MRGEFIPSESLDSVYANGGVICAVGVDDAGDATNNSQGIELDYSQLTKLLGGIDLRSGRRRRRYRRVD